LYYRSAIISTSHGTDESKPEVLTSYASTPEGDSAFEKMFTTACAMGNYGVENIKILSSDVSTVTFRMQHSFQVTMQTVELWFKNANPVESPDFCWFDAAVEARKDFLEEFHAQCINGWATITISGSNPPETKQLIEIEEPKCQNSIDLPDFNPQKRCIWQIQIPCLEPAK